MLLEIMEGKKRKSEALGCALIYSACEKAEKVSELLKRLERLLASERRERYRWGMIIEPTKASSYRVAEDFHIERELADGLRKLAAKYPSCSFFYKLRQRKYQRECLYACEGGLKAALLEFAEDLSAGEGYYESLARALKPSGAGAPGRVFVIQSAQGEDRLTPGAISRMAELSECVCFCGEKKSFLGNDRVYGELNGKKRDKLYSCDGWFPLKSDDNISVSIWSGEQVENGLNSKGESRRFRIARRKGKTAGDNRAYSQAEELAFQGFSDGATAFDIRNKREKTGKGESFGFVNALTDRLMGAVNRISALTLIQCLIVAICALFELGRIGVWEFICEGEWLCERLEYFLELGEVGEQRGSLRTALLFAAEYGRILSAVGLSALTLLVARLEKNAERIRVSAELEETDASPLFAALSENNRVLDWYLLARCTEEKRRSALICSVTAAAVCFNDALSEKGSSDSSTEVLLALGAENCCYALCLCAECRSKLFSRIFTASNELYYLYRQSGMQDKYSRFFATKSPVGEKGLVFVRDIPEIYRPLVLGGCDAAELPFAAFLQKAARAAYCGMGGGEEIYRAVCVYESNCSERLLEYLCRGASAFAALQGEPRNKYVLSVITDDAVRLMRLRERYASSGAVELLYAKGTADIEKSAERAFFFTKADEKSNLSSLSRSLSEFINKKFSKSIEIPIKL